MPTPAYMEIEGSEQGSITSGAGYQEEHEDEILVQAYKHKIKLPINEATTEMTGHRIHTPLTITKIVDKSSPMLYVALCRGERLTKCNLKFYRTNAAGQQEHFFTIKLEEAIITEIEAYMPHCYDKSKAHMTNSEDVSFAYRKISWTHEVESTSGEDEWQQPFD